IKRIAVLNPGFVSDCLETLEEIAEEAAESFRNNGSEKFTHIPCLNDSPEGMTVLEKVVRRELSGWVCPRIILLPVQIDWHRGAYCLKWRRIVRPVVEKNMDFAGLDIVVIALV